MTIPDIDLILFDIDGTLLLPKGAGRAATRLAMLEVFQTDAGLDGHRFGGKTDWRILLDLLGDRLTDADIRRLMPDYAAAMARHLHGLIGDYAVEACPGALELVERLRDDSQPMLGLVTGNVADTAPIKLRAAGFDPAWFAVGAYGSEAADRNHLPFLAVERAERLAGRSIHPSRVVVIGDTAADIECARALGAAAVAVLTGFSPREELAAAAPDYLLENLTQFRSQVMGMAG